MAGLLSNASLFLVAAVLSSVLCFSSEAAGSGVVPKVQVLSAAMPTIGLNSVLAVIAVFAVLVGIAVVIRLRRHLRIVAVAIAVVVVIVAGFAAVWYGEASINYWLVSPYTTWTEDNPLTMYCENTGHLAGTFDLVLAFTNAHFSLKTSLPYTQIDDRTVKFTFTLQPGEAQNRQTWFIIDNNVSDFYISLSFQQNDGNFLVRSGPGGVDSVSYQKDTADVNFTLRTFAPPP